MVIYADILFVLNAVIDYLLLLISARAAGMPLRRGRFALGAGLGGLYAVAIFLPGFSFLQGWVYKLLAAALMLLTAYGTSRHFFKQALLFLALTCALGGGILAIGMLDGGGMSLDGGVVYSIPDLKLVLLAGAGTYLVLGAVLPRICRHTGAEGELKHICFVLGNKTLELTALVDTGNTLTDPATGHSVPVAEGAAVLSLFPEGARPTPEELRDPVSGMTRLNRCAWSGRFRLLPYRAVGVERGLLLGVKMDNILLDGRQAEGRVVALSPTPVSDGGGYRVLMGG